MSALDEIRYQALRGLTPRHVIDCAVDPTVIDPEHEEECRYILKRALDASGEMCDEFEQQCWELESLEDAGLSGRIRYLTTVAYVAAYLARTKPPPLDRLLSIHGVLEEWRPGATYDLSNVTGALMFRSFYDYPSSETLGFWIWLNLGDAPLERRFDWVRSTMRFADMYGKGILDRV